MKVALVPRSAYAKPSLLNLSDGKILRASMCVRH